MDGAGAHPGGGIAPARPSRDWLSWLLPVATALVIIVVSVHLLTLPPWMQVAADASGAGIPGCSREVSRGISGDTISELLGDGRFESIEPFGPGPDCPRGPVYTADEAAHLRDAKTVLGVFDALA